ncbi:hypothetical protein DK2_000043 [Bacillus phage DK2]|uniref:Uncharacterized protein n=2 Tax=Hemphillvirus TaxID=2842725 RepID=A0A3T0IJ02_9CAUD|nr:hypothetical protein H3016_gp47 [Bacillus phage DK1]YP_009910488.1 hypothetical protein H3017_gp43 [Bacillus phage DK2]AZU99751.1 hypothetical protein DK1_000047 [Bacillus phage DK1]AZU99796.1 hypothetical protein DK2_000043 [Bacillus phage DK2]
MSYSDLTRALLEISRQQREGLIDLDLSVKLEKFCKELHIIWKEKVNK